jgi:hypothetical protein
MAREKLDRDALIQRASEELGIDEKVGPRTRLETS